MEINTPSYHLGIIILIACLASLSQTVPANTVTGITELAFFNLYCVAYKAIRQCFFCCYLQRRGLAAELSSPKIAAEPIFKETVL